MHQLVQRVAVAAHLLRHNLQRHAPQHHRLQRLPLPWRQRLPQRCANLLLHFLALRRAFRRGGSLVPRQRHAARQQLAFRAQRIQTKIAIARPPQIADGDAQRDARRPGREATLPPKAVQPLQDAQHRVLRVILRHLLQLRVGAPAEVAAFPPQIPLQPALQPRAQRPDGRLLLRRRAGKFPQPCLVAALQRLHRCLTRKCHARSIARRSPPPAPPVDPQPFPAV